VRKQRGPSRLSLILAGILVLSVILVSVYAREGSDGVLHRTQDAARDAFSVPLSAFKNAFGGVQDWFSGVIHAGSLTRENRILREQVRESRKLVLEARDLQRENEKLRKALDFRSRFAYATVPAEVILIHQELGGKLYTVDRGTDDGVARGDPVVTPDGLLGKVWSAGKKSAVILPLTHPLSAVSVRIVETNEVGILEGSRSGRLFLRLIPKDSKAAVGDVCVTSGLGSVFPKGIYVGSILSVRDEENQLDKGIEIGSAVDFDGPDFVFILTGQGGATQQ
jgi:rod shape-determining protein MreC